MKIMTLKYAAMTALIVGTGFLMSGCNFPLGEKVEIPAASVGKVMTKHGYKEGHIGTSKFRLDACVVYCDRLVILDVSDQARTEKMPLFMPKDRLNMDFDIRVTLAVNPNSIDDLFNRIPPTKGKGIIDVIEIDRAYNTYAQQIILSEAREYLSQFTIAEVASNREQINKELGSRLQEILMERTPFLVRYAGLADVQYPQIILEAQENAAQRREMIQQEEAQLEISKVTLNRKLQEQQMQRAIDIERAEAEAQVNEILADSMTPAYAQYRSLDALDKIANSSNKVFVPSDLLNSLAGQVMLGNAGSK